MSDKAPCFCGLCVPKWNELDDATEDQELVIKPEPPTVVVPQVVILPKPLRPKANDKASRFTYPE